MPDCRRILSANDLTIEHTHPKFAAHMWLNGRRSERPDRQYYRTLRRGRLSRRQKQNASLLGAAGGLAFVGICVAAWWMFAHH